MAIKRIMSQSGMDLALYGPANEEPAQEAVVEAAGEEEECVEEDLEEEAPEDDPCF